MQPPLGCSAVLEPSADGTPRHSEEQTDLFQTFHVLLHEKFPNTIAVGLVVIERHVTRDGVIVLGLLALELHRGFEF